MSNNEKYNQIIDEVYKRYTDEYVGYEDVPNKELFVHEIKTNPEFSKKWGLKIEERELSLDDGTPIKEINIYHRPNKSVDFIECRITILPTEQKFEDE